MTYVSLHGWSRVKRGMTVGVNCSHASLLAVHRGTAGIDDSYKKDCPRGRYPRRIPNYLKVFYAVTHHAAMIFVWRPLSCSRSYIRTQPNLKVAKCSGQAPATKTRHLHGRNSAALSLIVQLITNLRVSLSTQPKLNIIRDSFLIMKEI